MAYHIAVDSCTDMTAAMKKDEHITLVPLTLNVGEDKIIDDETFNQAEFLRKVAECPEAPSSACPSPDAYMQAYGYNNEDAYAITLSSELSGSYNSAKLGADLLKEEYPDKKIHVFNSRSASAGQTLILMKLQECLEAGKAFSEVVSEVEQYIEEQTTLFVLESLEISKLISKSFCCCCRKLRSHSSASAFVLKPLLFFLWRTPCQSS